jgi:MFS family permease
VKISLPAALAEPNFARFITGYTISLTGSAMVPVAIAFTLYAQGGGAVAVSKVLAAETIPMVLLLLLGGAIADRYPRRRVMIAADLSRLCSQGMLACLLLLHHAPLPVIMLLMALIGIGNAFYVPGRSGLIPQLVSPAHLQSANGILAISQSAGGMAGPLIAGLLVAGTGGATAIALDAASYAISALLLTSLTLAPQPISKTENVIRQLRQGWSEFRSRLWLWSVVVQFSFIHLLVFGPLIVLGSLGFSHMDHGALQWGGLLAFQAAGATMGAFAAIHITARRPVRAACLWFLVYALLPASLAAHWPYPITAACFFAGGFGVAVFAVLWDTTLQREIPPAYLSRVNAYDMFGSVCLLPAGYLLAAPLAAAFGPDGALWLAAAFTLVSTIAVLCLKDVQKLVSRPADLST